MSLSAVATDPAGRSCLYLQVDGGDVDENGEVAGVFSNGRVEGRFVDAEGEADPLESLTEMFLVFSTEEDLQKAFEAMCEGALRNPDSDEEGDGEEMGMGGWFTSGSLAEGLEANVGLEDAEDPAGDHRER